MILFLEDWNKPENAGAFPDFTTTNKSFLKVAVLFKRMGVDNSNFLLALHDKDLLGVNPHDPNLSADLVFKIIAECHANPWYFFREIAVVSVEGSMEPVRYKASRANISLMWLFFLHVTVLLIQPRQTGKSVSTDILMIYLLLIGTTNTNIILITKDDMLRAANINRIKNNIDALPAYLSGMRTKKDTDNNENLTIKLRNNKYSAIVGQASVEQAYKAGKGLTSPIFHVDEFAHTSNIKTIVTSALPATRAAREVASENDTPYGNIYTTTPGKTFTPSGEFAHEVYQRCFRWSEKLFDLQNAETLREYLKLNTRRGASEVLLEYNHNQLGYTDQEVIDWINTAMTNGEDAAADFLNLWGHGGIESPIPKEHQERILKSVIDDSYTHISTHGYISNWYCKEEDFPSITQTHISVGLDTSDAMGDGDGIAAVFRNMTNGNVLGKGEFNAINLITFSEWVIEMMVLFPNSIWVIERKSSGMSIIDNLLKLLPEMGIDPFKRLFNWVVNGYDDMPAYREVVNTPVSYRDRQLYVAYKKEFGYATSGGGRAARDNLYGTAFNASIKYTSDVVNDKGLAHNLLALVRVNGRIDHPKGGHDDDVIAWLLAYWFLLVARNKDIYGIPPNLPLRDVHKQVILEAGGRGMIEYRMSHIKLKEELDELAERIRNEKSNLMVERHTLKLRMLYKQIDFNIVPAFNLDDLLEKIKFSRKKIA